MASLVASSPVCLHARVQPFVGTRSIRAASSSRLSSSVPQLVRGDRVVEAQAWWRSNAAERGEGAQIA